jgi:hypothetical protein
MKFHFLIALILLPVLSPAQLAITVSAVKSTGNKAVVPLALENKFSEKVESARAVVFLLDAQGRVVGQATKWIIGGSKQSPPLPAGATNTFNFVISMPKPLTTTNLNERVSVTRLILASGRVVDPTREVTTHTR